MGVSTSGRGLDLPGERRIRLVLALSMWQLLLHLGQCVASGDPRLLAPHAVAYLHDVLLLSVVLGVASAARRLPVGRPRSALEALSVVALSIAGALLAIYPQLLREFLAFPVNVFATDAEAARALLMEYLGLDRLWPAAVAAAIGFAALVAPARSAIYPRLRFWTWALVLVLAVVTLPRSPHPFLFSLRQQVADVLSQDERAVPSLRPPPPNARGTDPAASVSFHLCNGLRADHIFLIVLEGVTSEDFEVEFLTKRPGFYSRVRDHAAYFRKYYATNLDSYTGLIAMLTSVHVPYRAYAAPSSYDKVNGSANLTRLLRGFGFRSLFISTYADQPFVPALGDWDRVLDRGDLPRLDGWVSLGSSRMEAATEDRAALSTIVEWAVTNAKAFVLHEMVHGHSPAWRAATGKTQLAYYDDYLSDLLDRLEASGLDSRSLLVIVSDHGDRAKAAVAENYRVPLLVVGRHVRPTDDAELRSHLDLEAIMASYLADTALPPSRQAVYVVGSTERWVYGVITEDGKHLFIDDATGKVLSSRGDLDPVSVSMQFQSSLDAFGARFGD